jgi:hypothetical protein
VENRLAPLYRSNPAGGKGLPVAYSVHLVQDRNSRIARAQKIGVQRMDRPLEAATVGHGPPGSDEGLGCDLTAEDAEAVLGRTETSVNIHFELFEVK